MKTYKQFISEAWIPPASKKLNRNPKPTIRASDKQRRTKIALKRK